MNAAGIDVSKGKSTVGEVGQDQPGAQRCEKGQPFNSRIHAGTASPIIFM